MRAARGRGVGGARLPAWCRSPDRGARLPIHSTHLPDLRIRAASAQSLINYYLTGQVRRSTDVPAAYRRCLWRRRRRCLLPQLTLAPLSRCEQGGGVFEVISQAMGVDVQASLAQANSTLTDLQVGWAGAGCGLAAVGASPMHAATLLRGLI